jgi:DNA-binding Lrp family transcriptional regulator
MGSCSCILWYKDMPVAYLLITCNAGLDEEVLSKLNELPDVVEANRVSFGPYDIIVKVDADTIERFNQTVGGIKRIRNITSAVTLIKNIEEPA